MRLSAMLLAVALFAAAGPVMAQGEPSPGTLAGPDHSGEVDRELIEVEPEPLPMVAEGTARDLPPGDEAALFGVVARSADGTVEKLPASQAVLDGIAAAISNTEPAEETTDRLVFGSDDRVRIKNATSYPFRAFGYLLIQRDADTWSGCSGTLIGPRTVLTAGHCVWKPTFGDGWPVTLSFSPGANSPDTAPYGSIPYQRIFVVSGFIDSYDPNNYTMAAVQTDMAVIILKEPVGDRVGWLGYRTDDGDDFDAHIAAYPGDKPNRTLWRADCQVSAGAKYPNYLAHYCDTFSGSSGGGMYWIGPDDHRYIRAINVGNMPSNNWAIRLNEGYIAWLQERRE